MGIGAQTGNAEDNAVRLYHRQGIPQKTGYLSVDKELFQRDAMPAGQKERVAAPSGARG